MRKYYEAVEVKFEYFESSDVMSLSAPVGDNNDGTIDDVYGDLL